MKIESYTLIFLLLLFTCLSVSCKQETEDTYLSPFVITGSITASETWENIYDDPEWIDYVVQGSFQIENGAILTIEEDILIAFKEDADIYIDHGSLKAIGSDSAPIVFTALDTVDKYWNGIFINQGSLAELRHCQIKYAGAKTFNVEDSIGTINAANIACYDGLLDISHSIISNSEGCGIALIGEDHQLTQAGIIFSDLNSAEICE